VFQIPARIARVRILTELSPWHQTEIGSENGEEKEHLLNQTAASVTLCIFSNFRRKIPRNNAPNKYRGSGLITGQDSRHPLLRL
jgi:hypothetical protein